MFNYSRNFSFRQIGTLLLYLFSVIVLGGFFVGPASLRVYATVLMFFYILANIKRFKSLGVVPISKSYIKLYVAFLLIFFFCLIVTGDIESYGLIRRILAYDFVCIVTFFAIYLKVNNDTQIRYIVLFLLAICLFDAIITILQMSGQEIGWTIGHLIKPFEDDAAEIAERNSDIVAISIAPGIFGNVVSNAFVLASFAPLVFSYYRLENKISFILSIVFTIVGVVAIFLTQQRAASYLFLMSLSVYLFTVVIKKPGYLLLLIAVLTLVGSEISGFLSGIDLGRLVSGHDDSRSSMFKYAIEFIPNHFLFGGISDFTSVTGLSAHNILLDSFIFAGVGGFITLMTFDIRIGLLCARKVSSYINGKCSLMTFALAMAMATCTLYGFTHNTSVLTGDVVVFILLALFLKSIQFDKICRK